MTAFLSTRYATPHGVIDLDEIAGNIRWRVKAQSVCVDPPARVPTLDAGKLRDRTRCRCHACGYHADRRGGRNVNHRFICAACP